MHLRLLDFVVIFAYFAGLFLLGIYFARRQTSRETYFLAGRTIPSFLAGISLLATLLSTVTYLSSPGEMIRYGIGLFTANFAVVLIIPVVNRIVLPALMLLPVTSIYEYLEKRFAVEVRMLAALVFVFSRLIWIGLIIYTASFAVAVMTGWSILSVVLLVGLITTFYTTEGGMPAVIWSDFAQFVILFGGALIVPFYVLFQTGTGPFGWWEVFSQAGRSAVPLFSFDPTVRVTVVGVILELFVWNICTHGADQVAAQRYLSTPSVTAARRSVWVFSSFGIALTLMLMLTGLSLFYFYFHGASVAVEQFQGEIASRADRVFPEFIARELPAGVSGLMLAALLAAAMSSLSSGINSISTVLVTDFVQRFKLFGSEQDSLRLPRMLAVGAGIFGTGSALVVNYSMQSGSWNLVELIERSNHLFVAPLGALFFAGILFRRVGSKAALIGFAAGVAAGITISFGRELLGLRQSISFTWIMPASFLVSLVVSFLVGFFFERPSELQLGGLTRHPESSRS